MREYSKSFFNYCKQTPILRFFVNNNNGINFFMLHLKVIFALFLRVFLAA